MPSSSFSRRRFLGHSLRAGAGAAAFGLAGAGGGEAWAAEVLARSATGVIGAPTAPATMQTFVSRPDLTPPGVSIVQTTDVAAIAGQPQYIFCAPRAKQGSGQPGGTQGLMITDLYGRLVWWQPIPTTSADPFDFRVQTYGGSPVLTWWQGFTGRGFGQNGTAHIIDGTYSAVASVATDLYEGVDLHEFRITPQDTALVTSYEISGDDAVYGHALELPIPNAGATTPLFDWSSEGNVPTTLSYVDRPDYFHINSIDLWPGSARNVLISSRNTWAVYLLDRQTKEIIWRIGGKDSSFTIGSGCDFEYSHDARPLSDGSGISLFDDASAPSPEKQSWGKVFEVDTNTMAVTLRHEYNHPNVLIDSPSQGNNQVLPTGGHLVGWGAAPYFTLFAASGSAILAPAILDGRLPGGTTNYRTYMNDWVGSPPASEMALVVQSTAGTGNFTAYMSWNGATEIGSWQVSAGPSGSGALAVVGHKAKDGFQTVIAFTLAGATEFQATALDAGGQTLGRTGIVNVT